MNSGQIEELHNPASDEFPVGVQAERLHRPIEEIPRLLSPLAVNRLGEWDSELRMALNPDMDRRKFNQV
ncbi:MAG: hypothetical protein QGM48_11035, partial [Actinomycetota bacterium]|nr:hypothetical protein [Actinomycetota bacterium]